MDTFKLQLGSPIIPPFVEDTLQCELAKPIFKEETVIVEMLETVVKDTKKT